MKSWTKSELVLSVLAALAAMAAARYLAPPLGRLLSNRLFNSALISMFLMVLLPVPVMGIPFFRWGRRGRRIWPWALFLAVCLGLLFLLIRNLSAAAHLVAVFTDFYDMESTAFYLLFALLICGGMLAGVLIGALLSRLFPKRYA